MDATTLGAVLALVGTMAGAVVAYLGKRGETAMSGYTHLTGDLQEERDRLEKKVTELERKLAEKSELRSADQAEITRLRGIVISLGGTP